MSRPAPGDRPTFGTVLVTGGSRGIGRAVVDRFTATGSRVVAVGRDASALAALAETVAGDLTTEACDVTDEAGVAELFDRVGPVDVLVANAGISTAAPVAKTTLEDWHRNLAVNATGVFLCIRAALPAMQQRDSGRIVTVASVSGHVGSRYTVAYTASKHAAVGVTRAVAAEVAGTGVTANAVCPAYVRTDMTAASIDRIVSTTGRSRDEAQGALERLTPLGRLLEPEEVADAVVFLAGPRAGAINGQTVVLDGGGIQA